MAATEVYGLADAFARDYPVVLEGLGRILVLGAVSGVGRSSVGEAVQAGLGPGVALLRNYTTRPRRTADEDARLIFGDSADLQERTRAGDVLFQTKWEANGAYYALLRSEIRRACGSERVLFESTHLCWPLKSQAPERVLVVWLTCADPDTLAERLAARGTEPRDEQERRIRSALREQQHMFRSAEALQQAGKLDGIIETHDLGVADVAAEVPVKKTLRFVACGLIQSAAAGARRLD